TGTTLEIGSDSSSTSSNGYGLTDSQMKQSSSFTGFNITDSGSSYATTPTTWFIYDGETYPLLSSFMTPLTVSAANATATYNGAAYTSAPTGVTYSPASPDTSNISGTLSYLDSSGSAPVNAGTYGLGGLYSGQQGYIISYGTTSGALTINPASLTVTANNFSYTYNGTAYSGGNGVTYSGFVNGETPSVLSGALTYSGSSQGAVKAGSYIITPGGLNSGNYAISFVNGTLTINSVYSSVFQAFWGNTSGGISGGASSSPSALNAMLTAYEEQALFPNVPSPWTGGHIYLKGLNRYSIFGTPYAHTRNPRHNR
ncbi:MAG: MBG domain-containing protein, partial [bacterium]